MSTKFDLVLKPFDIKSVSEKSKVERKGITFWIPEDRKEKFDRLQSMTDRALSKHIIDVIVKIIDSVDDDPSAA